MQTYYQPVESPIHRLNPLSKLVALVPLSALLEGAESLLDYLPDVAVDSISLLNVVEP